MRIALALVLACLLAVTIPAHRTAPPSSQTSQAEALASLRRNPVGEIAWRSVSETLGLAPMGTAIFAPGTPDAYIRDRQQRLFGTARFDLNNRWVPDGLYKGVTLTYSFPPDGTDLTGNGFVNEAAEANPNERINHLHARFAAFFGDEATWKEMFRDAYDDIESFTSLTFIEVADDGALWPTSDGPLTGGSGRGDLRIVSAIDDGYSAVLAFNYYPAFGGDMLIDSADLASQIFGDFFDNFRGFRNIIVHETGHGLGLRHSCPIDLTKVMEPFLNDSILGLQVDDMLGAQALYGDRFEHDMANDTVMTATPMSESGFVVNGATFYLPNLSINTAADIDVFQILSPNGSYVDGTVTVTPIFRTYLAGPQNLNGSCSPGVTYSTSARADLRITVRDVETNETTVIDDRPAGQAETGQFMMTAGKEFTVEISPDLGEEYLGIQGYNLSVRLKKTPHPFDLSQDGCIDGTDLAFVLTQWGDSGTFVPADITGDHLVDGRDIAAILSAWSPCQ